MEPNARRCWDDLTACTVTFKTTLPFLTSGEKWTPEHLNAFYSYYRRPMYAYASLYYRRYLSEAEDVFNQMAVKFYTDPELARCSSGTTFRSIVNQTYKHMLQDKIREQSAREKVRGKMIDFLKMLRSIVSRDSVAERQYARRLLQVTENFRDGIGLREAYLYGIDDTDRNYWLAVKVDNRSEVELAREGTVSNKAISAMVCKVANYLRYKASQLCR